MQESIILFISHIEDNNNNMQLDTKETYCEGQANFNVIVRILRFWK